MFHIALENSDFPLVKTHGVSNPLSTYLNETRIKVILIEEVCNSSPSSPTNLEHISSFDHELENGNMQGLWAGNHERGELALATWKNSRASSREM
jgi:hypothetical protein